VSKPTPPAEDIRLERCCAFLGFDMLKFDVGHAARHRADGAFVLKRRFKANED
jgi:hypothetical protein